MIRYYWKTRENRPDVRWEIEIHDTFGELLESVQSRAGEICELNVMPIDECIDDGGHRIRKFSTGETQIVVADLNLLRDTLADLYGVDEPCILKYNGGYSGHQNKIEALHYVACMHWPDMEHEFGEMETELVSGQAVAILLDKGKLARCGGRDCNV